MATFILRTALCLAAPLLIAAQNSAPQPIPIVDSIPAARDIDYPGVIQLEVDATDTARGIFKVREVVPVTGPGPLTMMVPRWLPGHHSPDVELDKIAGVEFLAGGRKLAWRRDPVEVSAYRVEVPAGATSVEARFMFLSATAPNQGRIVSTPELANVQWESVSMYPAGYYVRRIPIVATLVLPTGWQAATALRPTATAGNRITYGQVSFETLQDSPVFAGLHVRRDDLGHGVTLNSFAHNAKELAIPADVIAKHRRMVDQSIKTFGSRHFDHYDFLNAVSDQLGGIGLEHHRSTEISTDPGYYIDYANHLLDRNVFPHEFTHSWNGKFRRPAGQIVPDFRQPLRNDLLWVYEGQTQFWGTVLEARSGMSSKQDVLDKVALSAANLDNQQGRLWRPLVDTTYDPIIQNRKPEPWGSYQRNEDYYNEGMLIWFEADAIIRRGTGGTRGMDDFARAFFGVRDGDWGELPYTRDDLIRTLNAVYPYDWATFLHDRVDVPTPRAPLAGFAMSGYELRYTDEPTEAAKARAKLYNSADFAYSLGFSVTQDKALGSVLWGSPAFQAGLRSGDEIIAVGDRTYAEETLKDAVTAAKGGRPIRLIVRRGDAIRTVDLTYSGGLRYPRLVKVGKAPGALDRLLAPLP
ncbi:M61 family metallopeptidase [Sphingomonas sinipercae]|uniref:M61 family metallopeptidase n=1 Tax=Sphingomonas sinipercae TaxID=2714944 RepID=A0A6G7ZKF9_9SPHN|nr:PDZ domain-containing protein [Sphingomonas sinipercae]QIL01409.1 M61 family metallopeptidase [Sphingomonas sinipercae]